MLQVRRRVERFDWRAIESFEFLTSKFGQNSVGIQEKSARIHWKFSIFGIAHHFLEYAAKFRETLIKIGAKIDEKR